MISVRLMNHICTLFNSNYLPKGIALYKSLDLHCSSLTFWVLCLDKKTETVLNSLGKVNIKCIILDQFEKDNLELLAKKNTRNNFEYYFTCKSYLLKSILDSDNKIESATYVDADMYFFASFQLYLDQVNNFSVAITPHRFSSKLEFLNIYGKYNAGMLTIKNDIVGRSCLEWWREKCTEWCVDEVQGDRFADQKYIDQFPIKFTNVIELHHKGINAAPWNMSENSVALKNNAIVLNESLPLICYHFHGVSRIYGQYFDTGFASYARLNNAIKQLIYKPYMHELLAIEKDISDSNKKYILGDRKNIRLKNDRGVKTGMMLWISMKNIIKLIISFAKNSIISLR